ncbi:hypothetical protein ACQP1O_26140 [Nocardia sp. CA-151230]|uniref:hypothetical protein n=1 Tax=Nocardia sp. CA-151230 TaxID=3239982 RepID=UPI003D8AAA56
MRRSSAPITAAAVTRVPFAQHGIASGLVKVTRTLGGAIGLAVIAAAASDGRDRRSGSEPTQ